MQVQVLDTLFFPSEQNKEKLAQYIENAKQSIDISIFCFSNQYFALKVLEQSKNGLNVRILSDQEQCEETYSLVGALKETSDWQIKVRINKKDDIPRMHNKYIIIDNQIVLTGSFNFSDNALKCYENIVVMQGQEIAQKYTQNFEEIWQANNRNFTYNTENVKVGIKKFAEYVENQQEVMGKQLLGEGFAQKQKYNINSQKQTSKKNNYNNNKNNNNKDYSNSYKQNNNNYNGYKQYNKKQNYSYNKYNQQNKYNNQNSRDNSFYDCEDNFEGNQFNNYHNDSDSDSNSYCSSDYISDSQQQITKKIKKYNYNKKEYNNSYKKYNNHNNNGYKQYNKKQNYSYNKYNKYEKQSSSYSSFDDSDDNFGGNQYNNFHSDFDSDSDSCSSSY